MWRLLLSVLLCLLAVCGEGVTSEGVRCGVQQVVSASIEQAVRRGLGHRVVDLALTLTLANHLNITRSVLVAEWRTGGEHGSYGFFPEFAGLHHCFRVLTTHAIVSTVTIKNWTSATPHSVALTHKSTSASATSSKKLSLYGNVPATATSTTTATSTATSTSVTRHDMSSCGKTTEIVYRSCDRCCHHSGEMCDMKQPLRDLQALIHPHFEKQPFGAVHRHSTVHALLLRRPRLRVAPLKMTLLVNNTKDAHDDGDDDGVTVIGHIRLGDRVLGCDMAQGGAGHTANVTSTVADVVVRIIQEMNPLKAVAVYVMSDRPLPPKCQSQIIATTSKVSSISSVRMLVERDVQRSLELLLAADVVVGSGSSFVRVASVLSRWASHFSPAALLHSALTSDFTYSFKPSVTLKLPASTSSSVRTVGEVLCASVSQRRNVTVCHSGPQALR